MLWDLKLGAQCSLPSLPYSWAVSIGFVFIYIFLLFCFEESENWGNKTTKLRRETFGCLYSLLYYALVLFVKRRDWCKVP